MTDLPDEHDPAGWLGSALAAILFMMGLVLAWESLRLLGVLP